MDKIKLYGENFEFYEDAGLFVYLRVSPTKFYKLGREELVKSSNETPKEEFLGKLNKMKTDAQIQIENNLVRKNEMGNSYEQIYFMYKEEKDGLENLVKFCEQVETVLS